MSALDLILDGLGLATCHSGWAAWRCYRTWAAARISASLHVERDLILGGLPAADVAGELDARAGDRT
jgi:hypothetical protein